MSCTHADEPRCFRDAPSKLLASLPGPYDVFFVEGVHGVGKTELAKQLACRLQAQGRPVALLHEGVAAPLEINGKAYFENGDELQRFYTLLQSRFGRSALPGGRIWQATQELLLVEHGHFWLPYHQISLARERDAYIDLARRFDLFNGNGTLSQIMRILQTRWTDFWRTADPACTYICDGLLLQDLIIEMAIYRGEAARCAPLATRLWRCLAGRRPVVLYLYTEDGQALYDRLLRDRGATWMARLQGWLTESRYAKSAGDDIVSYLQYRKAFEMEVLTVCGLPKLLCRSE